MSGLPLQLVEALRHKLDGTPVELPPVSLPQEVPGVPEGGAAHLGPVERAEVALRLQDRCMAHAGPWRCWLGAGRALFWRETTRFTLIPTPCWWCVCVAPRCTLPAAHTRALSLRCGMRV